MAKLPKIPNSEAEKRRMASERRRSAQQRTRAASAETADAYPPQNFVVDPYPLPVDGVDTGVYAPIFVPHVALKDVQGRYPPRAFLQQLRQALAVHTLIAYNSLRVILGTTTAALDELARGKLPDQTKRLLTEGRKQLSEWTMLRSEEALRAYSERKFPMLIALGAEVPENFRSKRAAAEMSAVALLSTAYRRAQVVLPAFEKMQREMEKKRLRQKRNWRAQEADVPLLDPALHAELQAAFDRYDPNPHIDALWEIAVYSDVNSVVLWPQHINACA